MADGTVEFEVRANTDKLKKDLDDSEKKVKKSAKKSAEAFDDIGKSAEKNADKVKSSNDTVKDSNKGLGESYEDTAEKNEQFGEGLDETIKQAETAAKSTNDLADKASKLGGALSGTAKIAGASFVAIGGAAIAAGGYAVNLADSFDVAMDTLTAKTGASKEEMQLYEGVLKDIYSNNYGESFEDIADSISKVKQNLGNISDSELQSVTESALALRDTFEYDVSETTRAAKMMMDNFGISGDKAMELIAAGAQNGLDYSDELIDSVKEYAPHFKKIGMSADDMFKIFQKGADSGAWSLDKVGDAVKELSIRAIDGSDSTNEAFTSIGLNADEMSAKFGQGGDAAKEAFSETVKAIASIEDPLQKDAAGVALFGTMWEDLGPEVVTQLADIEGGAYDTGEALSGIKEVKYDNLGDMLSGLKRSVEMVVLPLGEQLIPAFETLIEDIINPLVESGTLEEMISSFGEFLEPLLQIATEALPPIVELFSELLNDDLMPLLTDTLLPALMDIFAALGPVIEMMVTELLPPLVSVFTELIPPITELITNLIPPLVAIFEALMPVVEQLITSLLPPLTQLFASLNPLIQALTPVVAFLADTIGKSLSNAISVVMPIIQNLIDRLTSVIDFITNVFTGNWHGAWDSIVEIFKSSFNTIPTIAESVINGAIGTINALIRGINSITDTVGISAIPEIPSVSLPRFHTGGIIDFEGQYEAPILAKDGEMVLTAAQQKRLFDIADGAYSLPSSNYENYQNSTHTTNVTITHENHFTVRNNTDIDRISESLAQRETKDILSLGGD